MGKEEDKKGGFAAGLEGILGGLSDLVEKLGGVAEKSEGLSRTGQVQWEDKNIKGVYGFSVKVGLGDEEPRVEPFGNIRKDEKTGKSVVQEVLEPMVDVFEEEGHTLVVAEMPGIGAEDVKIDIKDDLLIISAQRGDKRYRKEILLPKAYPREKMHISCNNGILEINCTM